MYAVANLMDHLTVSTDKAQTQPGALMPMTGVVSIIGALIFGFLGGFNAAIPVWAFVGLFTNGILFIAYLYIMLKVLSNKETETSNAIVWFNLSPLFGLILGGSFLGQFFSPLGIFGILLLAGGGIFIDYTSDGKFLRNKNTWLMILTALLATINDVAIVYFAESFDVAGNWFQSSIPVLYVDYLGKTFFALLFLLGSENRRGFLLGLTTSIKGLEKFTFFGTVFFLTFANDLLTIFSATLVNWSVLNINVALAQSMATFQPMFVFLIAFFLTRWKKLPEHFRQSLSEEKGDKQDLKLKILGIILMIFGAMIFCFLGE